MIFYFTGTGNSLYAAQHLSKATGEKLISIADEITSESSLNYSLEENETLGFVYPVYAWQPPAMVLAFIRKMSLSNYRDNYILSVCTCGDEEGYTTDVFKKTLASRGMNLNSGFAIAMPNNYIISFTVDSKEVEAAKIKAADKLLTEIGSIVTQRQNEVFIPKKGSMAYIKSFLVNPLFNKFAMDTKKFHVSDACTKCGLCVKICNAKTITMKEKPEWGKACTHCLACIHRCPEQAIQYNKNTLKKERYTNPLCKF